MSEKIEPALSAEEWRLRRVSTLGQVPEIVELINPGPMLRVRRESEDLGPMFATPMEFASIIALANAALPDSDPRKITRERVAMLRSAADMITSDAVEEWFTIIDDLKRYADALESYLPHGGDASISASGPSVL